MLRTHHHDEGEQPRMCMLTHTAVAAQMLYLRNQALLHGYRITRWKLSGYAIAKLERELSIPLSRGGPGICGVLFGAVLVQMD